MMANIANDHRGLIDPHDGDSKKMFFNATKGLDNENKFEMTSKNIGDFRYQVEEVAHAFFFGSVLFKVPIAYDDEVQFLDTANLVTETNAASKEDVQEVAS